MSEARDRYVYGLYDIAGVIFYIGVGKGDRAYHHTRRAQHYLAQYPASAKYQFIVDCIERGYIPECEILAADLTIAEAMHLEISLIKQIGRRDLSAGPLLNSCDGGHGVKNFSLETRALIAERTRAAMTDHELRKRLSEGATARMQSKEKRTALSAKVKATMASPEVRARMSEKSRARWSDPKQRALAAEKTKAANQRLTSEARAPA